MIWLVCLCDFGLDQVVKVLYPLIGIILVFNQIRQQHQLIDRGTFQVGSDLFGYFWDLVFLYKEVCALLLIENGDVDSKFIQTIT